MPVSASNLQVPFNVDNIRNDISDTVTKIVLEPRAVGWPDTNFDCMVVRFVGRSTAEAKQRMSCLSDG